MTLTRDDRVELFAQAEEQLPPRRISYQPALDGIRGIAVAAVVLYHARPDFMTGGYLGVDAFFVLSGYLITTLLLTEWHETSGIVLLRFWIHRARRLLPALFLMLLGFAAYCTWVAKPDVLDQLRGDGVSALFYVMNWRLILSGQSYFDQFFASPLRHMWSLAIEEQYYLFWPLITLAVMRWKSSAKVMMQVCIGLCAASALWMLLRFRIAPESAETWLYYGTDTRAQSLLVGSAIASAIASGYAIRTARARNWLLGLTIGASVVLAIAWLRLPVSSPWLYSGGFFVLACSVGLVILACTQIGANPVRSALAFEPLRRLGLISYGVYLYHWPIFLWLNAERTGLAAGSLRLLVLRLGVTLAVALASYFLVEKPIRAGALERLHLSALLIPVAFAMMLIMIMLSTAGAQRTTLIASDLDASKRPPPSVSGAAAGGAPGDTKVLLVGDSVAYTLGVGFETNVAPNNHVAVWNQAVLFCEIIHGDRKENGEVKPASDTCKNWESDWRGNVDVFKPDVTVLQLGAWEIFDRNINGQWISFGSPEYDAILEPALQRAVDSLSSEGAPVVVLTTPKFVRDDGSSAQEWTQNDVSRSDHFNELLRKLAAANPDKVVLVDLGNYLCPDNQCRKEIDGVRMREDGVHFKEDDAKVVAGWLAPQFRQIGLDWKKQHADGAPPGTTTVPPTTTAPTTTAPPEPPPTDPAPATPAKAGKPRR